MAEKAVIYWVRNDLRLADNPALAAAVATGKPVLPLFIWGPDEEDDWAPGAASQVWLDASLRSLASAYRKRGTRLVVETGDTEAILRDYCREFGATTVFASHRYEPAARRLESEVREGLSHAGADLHLFAGSVLNPPPAIETNAGDPYQVFTPYYKRCLGEPSPAAPLPEPDTIPAPESLPKGEAIEALGLLPDHSWADRVIRPWSPGESGAHDALEAFLDNPIKQYSDDRDFPAQEGTSCLSPHLHFGEISPRQIWHAVQGRASSATVNAGSYEAFIRQLYWREFAHHLLYHFPETPEEPLKKMWTRFSWKKDRAALKRWQRGRTGYPFVDAAMRQLWETGWMQNRVRMIVGSFLIKDLRIHWREGADWFWDTLVDADLANNTLGWQWVAGCGADASPFFRVFNPITQGERFDPEGEYVRHWVPELKKLPGKYIHKPWALSKEELKACGVTLGEDYPEPMVDHDEARKAALDAYDELKSLAG